MLTINAAIVLILSAGQQAPGRRTRTHAETSGDPKSTPDRTGADLRSIQQTPQLASSFGQGSPGSASLFSCRSVRPDWNIRLLGSPRELVE
jgi:hypothetical protein